MEIISEKGQGSRSSGPSRRAFVSISAATATAAVAGPIALSASPAHAGPAGHAPLDAYHADPALRQLLKQIDPHRIQATIQRLVQFGDRKSVRVGKECRSRWSPYH